jgi:hypothetical protein
MTVSDLRRELEAKNNTIRWLEAQVCSGLHGPYQRRVVGVCGLLGKRPCLRAAPQVSAAKDEATVREKDVRSLGDEKAAVAAEVAAAVARDKQQVEMRLAQALQVGTSMLPASAAVASTLHVRQEQQSTEADAVCHLSPSTLGTAEVCCCPGNPRCLLRSPEMCERR